MEVRIYECFLTRNFVFLRCQIGSNEDPEGVFNTLKALCKSQIPQEDCRGLKQFHGDLWRHQETNLASEESKEEPSCARLPGRQTEQESKKDFLKLDGKGGSSAEEVKNGMALEKRFIMK